MSNSSSVDSQTKQNFWQAFEQAYLNREALSLFLLGLGAGVPTSLIFSSLGLWLREAGIDRSTVTMFSWAALGYSFKFIWSPLVETLKIPILHRFGKRKSWLLLSQILIISAIIIMAMTNPQDKNLTIMAFGAVLLGFSAATQDIVIDAYRIECAPSQRQPVLSASYIGGYRFGMAISGAGALYLADYFGSKEGHYHYFAWQKAYLAMACVMLIVIITTLSLKEPISQAKNLIHNTKDSLRLLLVFILSILTFIFIYRLMGSLLPEVKSVGLSFLFGCIQFMTSALAMVISGYLFIDLNVAPKDIIMQSWVSPITDFFYRYGKKAGLLLALIGLYRISDIVAGNISNIFYQDIGFDKTQIARAVKMWGVVASIGGGFIGGWIAQKIGTIRAMLLGAALACLTNLLFIVLFNAPNQYMLYMAVLTDNLAAGLASAVFIAFLSALTSIRFTATQYALFSSLMTLSPKLLGGYSGAIVDATGYPVFFTITFIIGIPVLYLVYIVGKKIPLEINKP